MNTLPERSAELEALLFVATKSLSLKSVAEVLHCTVPEVEEIVNSLEAEYRDSARGIQIVRQGASVQLMSHPRFGPLVAALYREETTGELTRPSLETLTIIAYRGPIRKSELDQIRGVNCALILRNLLLRGLVQEEESGPAPQGAGQERLYALTMDCLRFLGITNINQLPDYEVLHAHEKIVSLLQQSQ